jgi:hypothetical protein
VIRDDIIRFETDTSQIQAYICLEQELQVAYVGPLNVCGTSASSSVASNIKRRVVKANFHLCLIKYHAKKEYEGVEV